eukprot:Em0015g1256a
MTQCSRLPAVVNEMHLLLFDARHAVAYNDCHILLAKHAKKDPDGKYRVPFGVYLPTCQNCVVYDSNTVSPLEDTHAVQLAHMMSSNGSRNAVKVLKGGYERFSAEYPFLRTQKILYTPTELECLPHYPSEIIPLFLYLGDERHAFSAATNHDVKIHVHLNASHKLDTLYSGAISELRVEACDDPATNLLPKFGDIVDFLESHRNKSERVLVFSEMGVSSAAVITIAYLMKKSHWSLKVATDHVRACRPQVQPAQGFINQLTEWEKQLSSIST